MRRHITVIFAKIVGYDVSVDSPFGNTLETLRLTLEGLAVDRFSMDYSTNRPRRSNLYLGVPWSLLLSIPDYLETYADGFAMNIACPI